MYSAGRAVGAGAAAQLRQQTNFTFTTDREGARARALFVSSALTRRLLALLYLY